MGGGDSIAQQQKGEGPAAAAAGQACNIILGLLAERGVV